MYEIWLSLAPILLADIVNPVLFAFMVYAVSTQRPVINSTAILFGHTLAYFSAGLVIALGLERISLRLANPQNIDYIIGLLVGILLLLVAFLSSRKKEKQQDKKKSELTPFKALGLGAVVNFGYTFRVALFCGARSNSQG